MEDHPLFSQTRTVRIGDTDAAGIAYFASSLRICHESYEALLEARGIDVRAHFAPDGLALPIVHVEGDYQHPLRFGDRVQVNIERCSIGNRSYTIEYSIAKESGEMALKAKTVHVAVMLPNMAPTTIPDVLRRALSQSADAG
jgi:1,4-dihydroxy-2-naphthoyl-CoA hydrolase